jgi:ADP-dependent NAD(P)H-hydrate dehydratase / NAD(P)H-hydrate epimerase
MKILTTAQIRELDSYTISQDGLSSIDLMERACHAFVNSFTQHFDLANKVGVVCGTGNNGGDGLGIARLLHASGYSVKVWIVAQGRKAKTSSRI